MCVLILDKMWLSMSAHWAECNPKSCDKKKEEWTCRFLSPVCYQWIILKQLTSLFAD